MTSVYDTLEPRADSNYKPIQSRLLRRSLDRVMDIFGICLTDFIFEDMHRSGIVFGPDKSYSMEQIHDYFSRTLGKPTADLLVKQLHMELQST
jgi:hypothetical protein